MAAAQERTLEAILDMPLTQVRLTLAQKFLNRKFERADLEETIAQLDKLVPPADKAAFEQEKDKIDLALKAGSLLSSEPNLKSPETQLLWAANLAYAAQHSTTPIHQTELWHDLTESQDAKYELMKHAFQISRNAVNPNTRLKWGNPGTLFYFHPTENQINIDFLFSLIGGFEDTRSIIFHEIGHSKLTRKFTDRMQEIRTEMEELDEKRKKQPLAQDEYKRLVELSTEWGFRHRVFDEAENSVVNRYTINLSNKSAQDYGLSLNIVETTIAQAGDHKLPDQPTAEEKFKNLNRAVRLSLYKNNGFFPDDKAGWERLGVRTDWIEALPKSPGGKKPSSEDAFRDLMELCGGSKGLEHLQPGAIDRMRGADWLEKVTYEYSDRRNAIIDEIWARYAEPLVEQMIEEAKNKAQDQMKQNQQGQGNQQGQQQGQGQGEGESQGGSGGSDGSDSTPVEGAGNMPNVEMPPQNPQDAMNRQADKNKSPKSDNEQGDKGGKSEKKDAEKNAGGSGEGEDKPDSKEGDDKSKDAAGGGKKDEPENKDAAGDGKGEEKQETPANGAHEKKTAAKTDPKDGAEDQSQQGDQQSGESQGQTIESLLQELEDMERARSGQGNSGRTQSPTNTPSKPGSGAGRSNIKSRPQVGNWSDYQTAVAEYGPEINQARNLLIRIQEKQSQIAQKPAHSKSLLPEDGDMGRFDVSAHRDLVTKLLTGRSVSEQDARRFVEDEEKKVPASIDVILKIDGSGSMYWENDKQGNAWPFAPINAGIQAGCILNEAAKKPRNKRNRGANEGDIDVYTMLWGNKTPLMLAEPGDDPMKIGQAIAGLKSGQGWGTELAPSIVEMTHALAEKKKKPGSLTGYSHVIIVSDGDIQDQAASKIAFEKLFKHCKEVTVDILVIQNGQTAMDSMAQELSGKFGQSRVGHVHINSPEQAQQAILHLLNDRMTATGYSKAIPFAQKQKSLSQAWESMR